MENPIARVCRERGLTRTQLAIFIGCDRSLIANAEMGSPQRLGKKILNGLIQLGYDREDVARQYEAWRATQLAQIRAKLVTV